jgi:hypothetical protein
LKFLGRARRFLQDLASQPESKVQYFNVTCASGHRVRGERTEGYQALRCPACGEGVFVLPKSPLPQPPAPARPALPKSVAVREQWVDEGPVELTEARGVAIEVGRSEPDADDAEIIWEDEAQRPPQPSATIGEETKEPALRHEPEPRQGAAARKAGPEHRKRRTAPDDRAARSRAAHAEVRIAGPPDTRRQPHRTSSVEAEPEGRHAPVEYTVPRAGSHNRRYIRLILILVPLLVVATVAVRSWRQKRQEYPQIIERGKVEGVPALEEGNFDKANQLLSAAKSAVDALGGAVDDADLIRTAADEASILVDQASASLEEMLDVAGRNDKATWATKFDALYKGRSIVIDSIITAAPGTDGTHQYEILYKVMPAGGAISFNAADSGQAPPPRVGWIDLKGFQLFEQSGPNAGTRVTFGARLKSFEYDDERFIWAIRLDPESGVFIQHTKALEALGWPGARLSVEIPKDDQP